MEVFYNFDGKNLIVRLVGELDEHSAEQVRRKLDTLFTENNFTVAILDLARMSFMDSTGIGVLIGRYKLLRKNNKHLFVKNPSVTIDKIFKMSGLYEIIEKI